MFAIATPQTVTLTVPGDDGPSTLINFHVNGEDTSRCVLEIVTPEGDTHRLTFNVRGQMVDSQFVDHDSAPEAPAESPPNPIVDGVDTRAFNPYTYQPPISPEAAARGNVGFRAANVSEKDAAEHRELREKDEREAAERAKVLLAKHLDRDKDDPKARDERARLEQNAYGLHPVDRGDNPKGDPNATVKTFPNDETQRLVAGKRMDGSPQQNPDNDPMAPAPSSPLPGSPPPHPLDQPDPGKVNTSKDLQRA